MPISQEIKTKIVPHGWKEAGIYLLTLNVNGRKPLLGRLEGTPEKARIEATELGFGYRKRYSISAVIIHRYRC